LQSLTRLTKVLQSSLNFQAYFFSIIKNKLSSKSVHKLNPITHTKHSRRKFRNCSAFDWPNSSFYFFFLVPPCQSLMMELNTLGHVPPIIPQQFRANRNNPNIMCTPLSGIIWPYPYNLCLQSDDSEERSFSICVCNFPVTPNEKSTWHVKSGKRGQLQQNPDYSAVYFKFN